jgi:hypothetical protein
MRPLLPVPPARPRLRRTVGGAAAAVLVAAALTACGGSSNGDATSEGSSSPSGSGSVLKVEVAGDKVTPVAQQVDLGAGEELTIIVRSDRDGELHVHSDPEHTYDFGSGTHTYHLTLDTPGSVDVEEHVSDTLVARIIVR